MTAPTHIGAVVVPRPLESESDLFRFQGTDLAAMSRQRLEREHRRLTVALGLGADADLESRIFAPIGLVPLTIESWMTARLELVAALLQDDGGR